MSRSSVFLLSLFLFSAVGSVWTIPAFAIAIKCPSEQYDHSQWMALGNPIVNEKSFIKATWKTTGTMYCTYKGSLPFPAQLYSLFSVAKPTDPQLWEKDRYGISCTQSLEKCTFEKS